MDFYSQFSAQSFHPRWQRLAQREKKVQQNLTLKFVIEMSKEFKFSKSKSIHEAIIECRSYIGRNLPNWEEWAVCVNSDISKKAS